MKICSKSDCGEEVVAAQVFYWPEKRIYRFCLKHFAEFEEFEFKLKAARHPEWIKQLEL